MSGSAGEGDARTSLRAVQDAQAAVRDEARPEAVAKQHARGKWTARERIANLVDAGTFREFGSLVQPEQTGDVDLVAPADGVVTGTGRVDGRAVAVVSYDFTVVGGSGGHRGDQKLEHAMTVALRRGHPLVMLFDGGGHRIQDGLDSLRFSGVGSTLRTLGMLSGWVPVVAAMMGSGFAGPSVFASLADLVVMVRGASTMGMAGPPIVKAGTGEQLDKEALGGASVQADGAGVADLAVDTEGECLAAVKRFLGYLPDNAQADLPVDADAGQAGGRAERLLDMVTGNPRRGYDVRKVIDCIADEASVFELRPTHARNIVTALARLDGRPVGVVANQPQHLAGMIDAAAAEKSAHFMAMCDAFGIPLVFLVDVPGLAVGSAAEQSGLARRSGKMFLEHCVGTVPRLTVVMRKAYGGGYGAMCGARVFGADLCVAWPTARICAMSIEGAVDIAYRREIAAADDPEKHRQTLIEGFEQQVTAERAAEGFGVDEVIDPRQTRAVLADALATLPRRHVSDWPPKFRSIPPI